MLQTMAWNRKHIELCHPVRSLRTFIIERNVLCVKQTGSCLIKEYAFNLSKALIIFSFNKPLII